MKSLIFSILILISVSCTPSLEAGQPASNPIFTLTPLTEVPNQSATPIASETPASITDSLVTGSVQIAGGGCCTGGTEGDTLQVPVSFSAASSAGQVTQMRVLAGCYEVTDIESVAWEPFVDSKTFPVHVALNWIGFYVCAQYQDEFGNLSPIYRDDVSVEGMPRSPLVNPVDWYPQIQCFSETEVHPHLNELVSGTTVTFSWPDKNQLPEGVFYKIYVHAAVDSFAGLAASGQTRENSISLTIDPSRAGQIAWYITLADSVGTQLQHGQCDAHFIATMLTVNPPEGLKAVFFQYQP